MKKRKTTYDVPQDWLNIENNKLDIVAKGRLVEKITGLVLNGYDPGIISLISDDKEHTINLPEWFLDILIERE